MSCDSSRRGSSALLLGLMLFLGVTLVLPVVSLLLRSVSDDAGAFVGLANFTASLHEPGVSAALVHTLVMGGTVTFFSVGTGFMLAYGLCRARVAGAGIARGIYLLPLFAPSLFPAVGLIYLFGKQGIARELLCGADLYGPIGIILGSIIITLPHVTLLLITALSATDPKLYEAARTMGVGPWRQFVTITLPQARYGIVSAALASFILTITDFGVPKVLGGNYSMLATEIYKQVLGQHNFALGASISIMLMLPSIAAFWCDHQARKKQYSMPGAMTGAAVPANPARDRIFSCLVWAVLVGLCLVFGLVVWGSFISFWPYDFSLTLSHYDFSLLGADGSPIATSLALATGAALAGPALIFLGAYCTERCPVPAALKNIYRSLALLPLSIPGTVLGLAYIFAYNRPGSYAAVLYGSLPLLVINTVIHFYTVGHLTCCTALQHINPDYETVGRTLSVPRRSTFFRIILPLSATSILDVALYFFVNALTTISALVFLYTPELMPAAVFMLQVNDTGNAAGAAAVGSCILALAFAARLLYTLLLKWLR